MRTSGRRGLVVPVMLALASVAFGASETAKLPRRSGRWIEVRTEHFTFFSNAGRKTVVRVARDLEELRSVLAQLTSLRLDVATPVMVYVFKNSNSFTPYKFLYEGEPASVSGYFRGIDHGSYIAMDASAGDASGIVFHEYVHYFLSHNRPGLPVWFGEGLGEFYQTFEVAGDRVRLGKPVDRHLAWLHTNPMIPLTELFAVDRASPLYNERDRKGAVYAQSWAMVHYLLLGADERQGQLQHYIGLTAAGVSREVAFETAFGDDVRTLEKELRRYVRRFSFRFLEFGVQVDLEQTPEVRALAYPEVLFRLGDLIAHEEPVRPSVAEHFRAALRAEPEYGPALAGLGLLAERHARWDEAEELYERAAAASPDDAMVQYRYAEFHLARGAALKPIVAALRRSTELDPGFGPAWAILTAALLEAGQYTEEALRAAETAHRLLPARRDVAINLVRLYGTLGRLEQAQALIETALSGWPAERARAQAVVARGGLERAYTLVNDGDPNAALAVLDELEPGLAGAAGEPGLRRRVGELRREIAQRELSAMYQEALRRLDAGDDEGARSLAQEVLDQAPEGDLVWTVQRLLRRIENPDSVDPDAGQWRLPLASRWELDQVNAKLAEHDLDGALALLQDLKQRTSANERSWLDAKIAEVRRAIAHNRFVETFNRAVDLFNGKEFQAAIEVLEQLLAETPAGADADSARSLLAKARAAVVDQDPP